MFHFVDLNLMASSFATFAASMGYACTRKIATLPRTLVRRSPSTTPPQHCTHRVQECYYEEKESLVEQDGTTQCNSVEQTSVPPTQTLKRKRQNEDQEDASVEAEYPNNLSLIYPPKKRSRTPSSETETDKISNSSYPCAVETTVQESDKVVDTVPLKVSEPIKIPSSSSDASTKISSSSRNSSLERQMITSEAFSAFAGPDTPFSKVISKSSKPAWLNMEPNKDVPCLRNECVTPSKLNGHVLEAAKVSEPTVKYITGEENEEIKLELKGVKLFIKRGDQPFTEGLMGQVKLLSDRATLDQRILFRREPLWQVSMNIRIHPSIRCTFDAEEHVLRIIHKESIEQKGVPQQEWQRQVVIYALKPSRSCSKQEFNDFAHALMRSSGLQAKPQ